MSRQHDREALAAAQKTTKPRSKPAPAPQPDGDVRSNVGNDRMGKLLQPSVTDTIEAELGGGKPLAETPAAPAAKDDGRGVRIHDDGTAADLSRELGAVAFTFGRDIFLSGTAPDLESGDGRAMLRHELTHVDQQAVSGTTRPRRVSAPDSPAEQQAARAQHGDAGTSQAAAAGAVHRQEEEEEMMPMRDETVHRQEDQEEEELMMMRAETVHRVGPDDEEEETPGLIDPWQAEAVTEAAVRQTGGDGAQQAQADVPANPALAMLFQTSVIDHHRAAVEALGEHPPQVEAGYEHVHEAVWNAARLATTYEESDPELANAIFRYSNAMQTAQEMLGPYVTGRRERSTIADSVASLVSMGEALTNRLH